MIVEYVRSQLEATRVWREFNEKRAWRTRDALEKAFADAGLPREACVTLASKHAASVLAAAFPLEDLIPAVGVDALALLADALKKKDTPP